MRDVAALLDKCREARSLPSDAALAAELRVTRQAVSNWRVGRAHPDAVTSARIADLLGLPVAQVLGIVGEARAVSAAEKAVWRRLATAAACLMVAAGLQLTPSPAQAFDSMGYSARMYIMSYRRRLASWLRAVFTPAPLSPAALA